MGTEDLIDDSNPSPLKDLADNLEYMIECHAFLMEFEADKIDADPPEKIKVYRAMLRGVVEVEGQKKETGVIILEDTDRAEVEKYVHATRTVCRLIARRAVTIALTLQRAGQLPVKKAQQRILDRFGIPKDMSKPIIALPMSAKPRAPAPTAKQADAIRRFSENVSSDGPETPDKPC